MRIDLTLTILVKLTGISHNKKKLYIVMESGKWKINGGMKN